MPIVSTLLANTIQLRHVHSPTTANAVETLHRITRDTIYMTSIPKRAPSKPVVRWNLRMLHLSSHHRQAVGCGKMAE